MSKPVPLFETGPANFRDFAVAVRVTAHRARLSAEDQRLVLKVAHLFLDDYRERKAAPDDIRLLSAPALRQFMTSREAVLGGVPTAQARSAIDVMAKANPQALPPVRPTGLGVLRHLEVMRLSGELGERRANFVSRAAESVLRAALGTHWATADLRLLNYGELTKLAKRGLSPDEAHRLLPDFAIAVGLLNRHHSDMLPVERPVITFVSPASLLQFAEYEHLRGRLSHLHFKRATAGVESLFRGRYGPAWRSRTDDAGDIWSVVERAPHGVGTNLPKQNWERVGALLRSFFTEYPELLPATGAGLLHSIDVAVDRRWMPLSSGLSTASVVRRVMEVAAGQQWRTTPLVQLDMVSVHKRTQLAVVGRTAIQHRSSFGRALRIFDQLRPGVLDLEGPSRTTPALRRVDMELRDGIGIEM